MGIPSYFSHIIRAHSNVLKKLELSTIQINNLYLDCNSIIYEAIYETDFSKIRHDDFEYICNLICNKIKQHIAVIRPNQNVFIAFDGVAPVAKLEQQRNRRYKSIYQNHIETVLLKKNASVHWNTTAITPGTPFMQFLNTFVTQKFQNSKEFDIELLLVSCSDSPGEGEHKVFEYIRQFPEQHGDKTTIIYGLDADLIMLSINHLPIASNIYLYRETPHFIKNICEDLEPNQSYIIDIPELANIITLDMNNQRELTTIQQRNRIYDYIFLCFFLGNDFLPHFPACNIRTGGIYKLLEAYKMTIGCTNNNLTDGTVIYWNQVRNFVKYLADKEEFFLRGEHMKRDRNEKVILPEKTPEEKMEMFMVKPIYNRHTEKKINPFQKNWKQRYYQQLFPPEISISLLSRNYLEGLEWTMKYYTSGCANWRWMYKFNYPPTFSDLLTHIPLKEFEFIPHQVKNPVNELVQLAYVLPKQTLGLLLPPSLAQSLLTNRPQWYNDHCKFNWAYCKYFWESHVELPEINVDELEEFVLLK